MCSFPVRVVPEFATAEAIVFDFPPKVNYGGDLLTVSIDIHIFGLRQERVYYSKEAQTTETAFEDNTQIDEEEIQRRVQAERDKEERLKLQALEEKARKNEEASIQNEPRGK